MVEEIRKVVNDFSRSEVIDVGKEASEFLDVMDEESMNQSADLVFNSSSESILGRIRDMAAGGDISIVGDLTKRIDQKVVNEAAKRMSEKSGQKMAKKMKRKEALKMQKELNKLRIPPETIKVALFERNQEKIIKLPGDPSVLFERIRQKLITLGSTHPESNLVSRTINHEYVAFYIPLPEDSKRKIYRGSEAILGTKACEFIIFAGSIHFPCDMSTDDIVSIRRLITQPVSSSTSTSEATAAETTAVEIITQEK